MNNCYADSISVSPSSFETYDIMAMIFPSVFIMACISFIFPIACLIIGKMKKIDYEDNKSIKVLNTSFYLFNFILIIIYSIVEIYLNIELYITYSMFDTLLELAINFVVFLFSILSVYLRFANEKHRNISLSYMCLVLIYVAYGLDIFISRSYLF